MNLNQLFVLKEAQTRNPDLMSPGDYDRYQQDQMDQGKRDFKRREHEAEWEQEKAYSAKLAAQQAGPWYIRLNGKLIRDKTGNPYTFNSKAAANKAALTMQSKLFNQGKEFMLTTNPNDPQQGVTEKIDSRFRKTEWIPIPDALKILKHYGATIEEWGGHFHFAYYDREGVRKRIEDLTWNADDTRNVRLSILNQAVRELKAQQQGVTEEQLSEFAPGNGGDESGRWYTDSELADIIGDDWFEDFDVSNDGFNMDAHGEKAKKNLVGYANSWFDDRGYNVNVLGVENNEVDHDLQWYVVGSFQNDNFAGKDVDEGLGSKLAGLGLAGAMALGSAGANARVTPDGQGGFTGGLKPSATVTAPADNKPAAEAPKGFSKEYLQKAADPNRFGRYMISVEKAQELLKNMQEAVAEGSQRVDSLVTDALKIMKGSDVNDAVRALKTVLGDREYNGRRGHYNFYVRQLMDMYGQQGVMEGDRTMSRAAKGYEKYGKAGMQALAKAGKEGKDLDKIRDKYNKYKESVNQGVAEVSLIESKISYKPKHRKF
jgi:hypothetical protein